MFKDEVEIFVKAGDGGNGAIAFRREKFVPCGGPAGGDGGKGGDVIFTANPHMNSLYHLTHAVHYHAENGENGGIKNCYGKYGQDLIIPVPVGTVIKDREKGHILKDLKEPSDQIAIVLGGKGGRGNKSFATPTDRTPRRADSGVKGEERWLKLELKLIADVGIVGLPNAGKSTLLSHLSAARPKIADYPFTTLYPYLGIVSVTKHNTFVMADLPGLIEGAHKGTGLGDKFLRHIERTRLILHLIDIFPSEGSPSPYAAYKTIRKELELYSEDLAKKPEIVVLNKMDIGKEAEKNLKEFKKKYKGPIHAISAATGENLKPLVKAIYKELTGGE